MEKEVEALKSAVVEHQRDAARRGESEAALRRENQQLRADAELLTPRTGKEILAARLEKAAATEKELRAEVAARTPRASKMKILAELNASPASATSSEPRLTSTSGGAAIPRRDGPGAARGRRVARACDARRRRGGGGGGAARPAQRGGGGGFDGARQTSKPATPCGGG